MGGDCFVLDFGEFGICFAILGLFVWWFGGLFVGCLGKLKLTLKKR